MLSDAELDELERLCPDYMRMPRWSIGERIIGKVPELIADLRSARATIGEMRGRLEKALGGVDAALARCGHVPCPCGGWSDHGCTSMTTAANASLLAARLGLEDTEKEIDEFAREVAALGEEKI